MYILIQRSSAINVDDLDNEELWQTALDAPSPRPRRRSARDAKLLQDLKKQKELQGRNIKEEGDRRLEIVMRRRMNEVVRLLCFDVHTHHPGVKQLLPCETGFHW